MSETDARKYIIEMLDEADTPCTADYLPCDAWVDQQQKQGGARQ